MFALAIRPAEAARDGITIPQQRLTKPNRCLSPAGGGRSRPSCGTIRMKQSDERLIDLYLDMLAAERGAAANTLEAYRRDLEDFAGDLRGTAGRSRKPAATHPRLSRHGSRRADFRPHRSRGGFRRSASSIASSTRKGTARTIRRPRSKARSAAAAAEGAVGEPCRSVARTARKGIDDEGGRSRAPARCAARLPA